MRKKEKNIKPIIGLILFFIVSITVFIVGIKPILWVGEHADEFRIFLQSFGWSGRLIFVLIVMLQVVIAFLPGEPIEIAAGFCFGIVEGTFLTLIGITLGSILVFLFVKRWGRQVLELFFSKEQIEQAMFLKDSPRLNMIIFWVFFLPGTPKDFLAYFVGLTEMKLSTWFFITFFARIPSVLTSVMAGSAWGDANYGVAITVFVLTGIISLIGLKYYQKMMKGKQNPTKD